MDGLKDLITSFWKPPRRDRFRLISYQYAETLALLDNSLVRYFQQNKTSCLLFCDLDRFKRINDTYGQGIGDQVILELSAVLQQALFRYAIPLHRSGDEFTILFPAQHPDEALSLARNIMELISSHDFRLKKVEGIEDVKVEISVGITTLTSSDDAIQYEALERRAEKGLKPGEGNEKQKNRGKARFGTGVEPALPAKNDFSRNVAFCLTKSCTSVERPFESPWLNMISMNAYDLVAGDLANLSHLHDGVKRLLNWIQPDVNEDVLRSALDSNHKSGFSTVFSTMDIAFAVAHGVFRAGLLFDPPSTTQSFLEIAYDSHSSGNCCLRLQPGNMALLELGQCEEQSEIYNLGGFVYSSTRESTEPEDSRRALLIKIGHFDPGVPSSIFVEEIVVDDRPTRGGGLPDFWEATIARLVARMNANNNIAAVYVMGVPQYGAQTIAKLEAVDSWSAAAEQLAYKTGMPFQSILTAADGLKGKIHLPHTAQELVASLGGILLDSYQLQVTSLPAGLDLTHRFLQRDLNINSMALDVNDGCRIDTIAQAFPVVLELARKVSSEEIIVDQAGQELRELVDFKVHLTNPTQDLVPTFYAEEKSSLEQYFNDQFVSDEGLFGRVFTDTKQLEIVLKHLVDAVTNPKQPYSTRRAVLIVPPDIKDDDQDFTPLGLISVRIIPRFSLKRVILHFSFTWRTVEALVGFPYSLYGSVRYGQYLTDEIIKLLPTEYERRITMGQVSYIAHSLHIFMDEHGQNIARRIVEDATS